MKGWMDEWMNKCTFVHCAVLLAWTAFPSCTAAVAVGVGLSVGVVACALHAFGQTIAVLLSEA